MAPLVSYILPVYNAAPYLGAAVESVLTQDYTNLEVILIDDGSTDGSGEILTQFAARDARIRLISRENRGLVATLNEGLDVATGALIARMDADDIAYPGRTGRQVAEFEKTPDLCLLGMGADFLFPGGRVLRIQPEPREAMEIRTELIFNPLFVHPSVMMNNTILKREGLRYDPVYRHCEDYELWSRIVAHHQARIIADLGLAWRQSHDSVRSRHFREMNVTGFGLIARLLSEAGVEGDFSVFSDMFAGGTQLAAHKERLKMAMQRAEAGRVLFPQTVAAYDRGFATLIDQLLDAAISAGDLPQTIAVVKNAGYGHLISRRAHLHGRLTQMTSADTAERLMNRIRTLTRRLKSHRLTDLESLPPSVLSILP